jgi:hypothetical protein
MSSELMMLLSPLLTKARQVESKIKVVLINFFDTEGLTHHKVLSED